MKRFDKRTLLGQILQGQISGLRAMMQEQHSIGGIVTVDQMPDVASNEPIQATYTASDCNWLTESLTYTEIAAKAGNILILLPDNYRRDAPV